MIDIANYFHKNCSTNNSLEIFPSRKVIINYVYRNLELYKENQREPDGKTASLKVIKKASGPGGPAGWQPVTNMLHVIRLLLLLFFLFLFFFFFHFLFSSTVRKRFVWGPAKARLVCPVQIFPPVYLCSGIGGSSARSAIWRTAGISTSFLLSERERGRLPWKTNSSDYWLDDQMKNFSTSENIWKWLLNYLTIRRINQLFTSHNICLLQFISVVQTFAYQPVHIVSPERRFRISVSSSRPPGRKSASSSSTSSTRKILRKPKPGISLGYVATCMIKTIDTHPTRRGSGTASSSESLWPGKDNRIKIKASVSRFSSCGFGFNGVENMRSSRNFRHIINYNVISLYTTYRLLLVLLAQMELTFSAPADALSFLSSFFSINSIVKIIHGRNASQRRMHPAGGRGVLKGVERKKEKNRQGETEFDPVYFLRGVRLPFVALLGMRLFSSLVC